MTPINPFRMANVGSALARVLERGGYAVRAVDSEPGKVKETGEWAGEDMQLAHPPLIQSA